MNGNEDRQGTHVEHVLKGEDYMTLLDFGKKYPVPDELDQIQESLKKETGRAYVIVPGFKAFNSDMTCLDMTYEEGRAYTLSEPERAASCVYGYHFCPNLSNVFDFYDMKLETKIGFVYGVVEMAIQSGYMRFVDSTEYPKIMGVIKHPMHPKIAVDPLPRKLCSAAIYIAHMLEHDEIVAMMNHEYDFVFGPARAEDAPWWYHTTLMSHVRFYKEGIDDTHCSKCGEELLHEHDTGGCIVALDALLCSNLVTIWDNRPVCARCYDALVKHRHTHTHTAGFRSKH